MERMGSGMYFLLYLWTLHIRLYIKKPMCIALFGTDGDCERDNGREWFGATTTFNHPRPASPAALHSLFPFYSTFYTPIISSTSSSGETIDELYDRVAYTLQHIIADLDADPSGPKSVLLCTHAATLIAIGRVLTGRIPMDVEEQDFKPFTCGLTVFKRRNKQSAMSTAMQDIEDVEPDTNSMTAVIEWRNGKGIAGGVWECVRNGDCSFLNGGQERGWYVLFTILSDALLHLLLFPSPFPPLPTTILLHHTILDSHLSSS